MRKLVGMSVVLVLLAAVPAMASFFDSFSYPDGDMEVVANPPWQLSSPDSAANVTLIQNGTVALNSGLNRIGAAQNRDVSVAISESGATITAQVSIKRGDALGSGNIYSLEFNDALGNNLARWYGGSAHTRPRTNVGGVLAQDNLTDDNWHTLKAVINTVTNQAEFFLDNVSRGTLAIAAGADTCTQVLLRATTRTDINPAVVIYFDNLSIPEPATLVLLGFGGLLSVRRRRA